jgi:hypothetical protein
MPREVDAITKLYDYLLWMIPQLEKFPRRQKFLIGDRIETLMLDILDLLIEAAYSRQKGRLLRQANLKLEKLRYLIRLSKDKLHQSIQSWMGHARHAKTYRLRKRLFADVSFRRGNARGAAGRRLEQQP